jgi:hypothetical protein
MRVNVTCQLLRQRFTFGRVPIYNVFPYFFKLIKYTSQKKKIKEKKKGKEN